jgi:hypothetical protein
MSVTGSTSGRVTFLSSMKLPPFLKATKTIPSEAWEQFGKAAVEPWGNMSIFEIMDEVRGPVELAATE